MPGMMPARTCVRAWTAPAPVVRCTTRNSARLRGLRRRRRGPGEQDPVHHPPQPLVVVDRQVPHLAVVPERDRARLPPEPGAEFRPLPVPVQVLQQPDAFPPGPALETSGVFRVDVEDIPPGFRMADNNGMHYALGGVV